MTSRSDEQLSPASQGLLALLSKTSPPEDLQFLPWDEIVTTAVRYRISGLLKEQVRFHNLQLPAGASEALRMAAFQATALTTGRLWQLDRVTEAMDEVSIPFIVLKGGHLCRSLYGNPALRFSRDFDLLLPKEQVKNVETVLTELGLEAYDAQGWETWPSSKYHITYATTSPRAHFELHWDLQRRPWIFDIDVEGLWRRAVAVPGGGGFRLNRDDEFAYLCLHLSKHRFIHDLIPFVDLLTYSNHFVREISWSTVKARLVEWKASRPAALVLAVLSKLFPRDVAPSLSGLFSEIDVDADLVEYARNRVFNECKESREHHDRFARLKNLGRHRRLWFGPRNPPQQQQLEVPLPLRLSELKGKVVRTKDTLSRFLAGDANAKHRFLMERKLSDWC